MEFYFLLILIILLQAFIIYKIKLGSHRNNDKVFLIITVLYLFIISAFRASEIGVDTFAYINIFQSSDLISLDFGVNRFEQGYMLFNNLIYSISTHQQAIIIATSFFTLGLFAYIIYKESKDSCLSIYLFITFMFFYSTMNAIRLNMAIAIFLYAYTYLKRDKIGAFLLLNAIAVTVHYTAVIGFIFYFLKKIKISFKSLIIALMFIIAIFVYIDNIFAIIFLLMPKYAVYLESKFWGEYTWAIYAQLILSGLICLWGYFIKNRYEISRDNELLLKIMLTATTFYFFALKASILDRLASYFFVFAIIMLPNFINSITNRIEKGIYMFVIYIMAFLYNLIIFLYRPEWYMVFPYKVFWE